MNRIALRSTRSIRLCKPSLAISTVPLQTRFASTYYADPEKKGIKIVHLFSALALVGIGATSYGLYQFYSSYTSFPSPIRTHLRAALRSAGTLDYPRASKSFEKAYELAIEMGDSLGAEKLLKTTGIIVKWGGMWESIGELEKAIECYQKGFLEIEDALELERGVDTTTQRNKSSGKEIMRGVAIALKIGDIYVASGKGKSDDQAEKYYVWAVEEMLRLSLSDGQKTTVAIEMEHGGIGPGDEDAKKGGLDLPEWIESVELAAVLERLGDLYTRTGNYEFAKPLLLQAISVLLPPPKEGKNEVLPSIRVRCHAATLMNNLSSALVSSPTPTPDSINQAARWARQAITVSTQCKREGEASRIGDRTLIPVMEREEGECEMVAVVASFNLGALAELSKDEASATNWYQRSSVHSKRLGIRDGAADALKRLKFSSTAARD